MTQQKKDAENTKETAEQNVFSQEIAADFRNWASAARLKAQWLLSDKLWRIEAQHQINAFVTSENRNLKESLNITQSKKDGRLYTIAKRNVLEEDVFKYFYPFCLLNCALASGIALRKSSLPVILFGAAFSIEYVYWLFNFPVESWHFHMRAASVDKPYAQFLRDSYIARFPDSAKANIYRRTNEREVERYRKVREYLDIKGRDQT